ncbi:MAG: hypothetical protein WCL21_04335 [Mariniphaga sp.]
MEIRICNPIHLNKDRLDQIIELIIQGGQIKRDKAEIKDIILFADLVAIKEHNGLVLSTATLKNQSPVYRDNVFKSAGSKSSDRYLKELGFIVTHPDFENQGHCQQLLEKFFILIQMNSIYATTRKPAMSHMLRKLGFRESGTIYNQDLRLFIFDSSGEAPASNIQRQGSWQMSMDEL